jgi:hypothetical protein
MKRKEGVNDNYFETIDTDLKAYLLGFFIADGCIQMNARCVNSYKLSVNISEIDKELIELYQKEICPNNKISISNYRKGAIDRKPTHMIRWTSNKMKNDLENFNVLRNKTKHFDFKFPFEYIPNHLIFSFIRGFFDGDGNISYDGTNRLTFAFFGTSKIFLQQIGEIFQKEFNVKYIIDESKKANMILYCLRFNSNFKRREFINNLYNKMYTNCQFSLSRKKLKFESYLNTVLNKENKKSLSV